MNIETNERYPELLTRLREAEKVVIGLGGEWKLADDGRPVRERRLSDDPAQKRLPHFPARPSPAGNGYCSAAQRGRRSRGNG